jgi:hypothetical protein
MEHLWARFLEQAVKTHFGWNLLAAVPEPALSFLPPFLAWGIMWWICIWMDRRKLYLRI